MRKVLNVFLAGLFVAGFFALAFTEDKKDATMGKDMSVSSKEGMMGKGEMMERKMMRHPMMGKSIVATSDGGVIVLLGNKLQKYDKDLNFVREVEISGMEKMMMEKMEKCSMQGKTMPGAVTEQSESKPEK